MVDRRNQRVRPTPTQSKPKPKSSVASGAASGLAAKDGLATTRGTGCRLDTNSASEPTRLGRDEASVGGKKWFAPDIVVVDCGSESGIHSVLALLAGLQVEAVGSVSALEQRLQDLKPQGPCALLCIARSADAASRVLVDELLRIIDSRPVLVIDECFEDDYGSLLIECGVLDYLEAANLSSMKLHRRIEWAILRNGHRAPKLPSSQEHVVEEGQTTELARVYECLPPRQRKILDLLLNRVPAKQIARRLAISVKTVHAQLAILRDKFEAASSQDLIIVVLRGLYQE